MESSKETTSMDTETTKSFVSSATTTTMSHKMIVDQAEMSAISLTQQQQQQQQQVLRNSKDISTSLNDCIAAAISDDAVKSDMNLIQKMSDMNVKGREQMNIAIDDSSDDIITEQKKSQLSEENQTSLISTSIRSSVLARSDQLATAKQTNEAIDHISSDDTVTETIVMVKKEVEISELPKENTIIIEDCPENGDEADAEVIIVVKRQISAEVENENEVDELKENGKTDKIEKESITDTQLQETVEKVPGGTTTTITTVKVVKKQVSPSAENTDSSDAESVTTTTVVTKKEIKPIAAETVDQNANDDDVDGCATTSTISTVITTAQPTCTTTDKKQADESAKPKTLNENVEVSGDNGVDDDDDLEELETEEEEEEVDEAEKESEEIITTKSRQQQQMIDSTDAAQNKETTSEDGPSQVPTKSTEPHQENIGHQPKKNNIDATIKEIISDIDSNIRDQEYIANLKQQEQELLRKQQQLAQQIQQQQILAEKLANENIRLQQQQLLRTQAQTQEQQPQIPQHLYRPDDGLNQNKSKYSTYEKIEDENGYKRETTESYETSESTNTSKKVDLHKIFTPAEDANEILPRNRKLYASSAFYSPTLHPTVEDQVELARRISHSLSDKSNQKSKGQSMYVNRKKRSVKWVHEGQGQDQTEQDEYQEDFKENIRSNNALQIDYTSTTDDKDTNNIRTSVDQKIPLRLLMNPFGQMRDYNSLRESINIETGLMSPDKCAELVAALKTQTSRGAELFAKRRKKSDKWIVDECSNIVNSTSAITPTTFTYTPSNTINDSTDIESLYCGNLTDFHQYQPRPPTSPSFVPAYSDAGKHRVQMNMHQEQVLEKYAKPSLKVVKTPWEAALETGSASAAFVEGSGTFLPTPSNADLGLTDYEPQQHVYPVMSTTPKSSPINHQRDLAYKPNLAQGWKAPGVTLPKVCEKLQQQVILDQQHKLEVSKKHKQYHQSYYEEQRFTNETVNTCELLNSKDEIIDCVKNEQLQNYQKQIDQLSAKKFDSHLVCSAESLSTPVPTQCIVYDNVVNELLQQKQQQQQWQQQMQEQRQELKNQANLHLNTNKRHIEMEKSNVSHCGNVSDQSRQLEQLERNRLLQLHREHWLYDHQYENQQQHLQVLNGQQLMLEQQMKQQQTQYDTISEIDTTKASVTQNEIHVNNETIERIPVHDLIKAFEKQSVIDTQLIAGNKMERKQHKKDSSVTNTELYVPKEIPLDSYAPPPTVDFKNSSNRSSGFVTPSNWQSTHLNHYDQYNKFPVNKQDNEQAGLLSTPSDVIAPTKENYWASDSFQTAPQKSSQNAATVNFNPSPLSYDKLAKFENPDPLLQQYGAGTYYSPPQSRQHLYPLTNGKYPNRNSSPSPFGSTGTRSGYLPASTSVSPRPFSAEQYYGNSSPLPTSNCNITARNLLNAPNYNKAARGWNIGPIKTQPNYSIQTSLNKPKPMPVSGNMPYTDF